MKKLWVVKTRNIATDPHRHFAEDDLSSTKVDITKREKNLVTWSRILLCQGTQNDTNGHE